MIRTFITGILAGIANVIPGVSGGSILVMMNVYARVMDIVANFTKKSKQEKINDIKFLAILAFGLIFGIIVFAKLMEYLLANFYNITMWWFLALIVFSFPNIRKTELKNQKTNWILFFIAAIPIAVLGLLVPDKNSVEVAIPTLSLGLMGMLFIIGFIAGATMIIPGVSGSLVLILIGYYSLVLTYASNILTFRLDVLIPVAMIGIGVIVAVLIVSKIMDRLLKTRRVEIVSIILGLIAGSAIFLIPTSGYTLVNILFSIVACGVGATMILALNRYTK